MTRPRSWITWWSSGLRRRTSSNRSPGGRVPRRHIAGTAGLPGGVGHALELCCGARVSSVHGGPGLSAVEHPLPSAFRASDEDRDEVIRMLRDGSVDGRISNETFLQRVDRALHARGVDELAELLSDLPPMPDEHAGPAVSWRAGSPPGCGDPPAAPPVPCRLAAAIAPARPAARPADRIHHRQVAGNSATCPSATSLCRGTTPNCGAAGRAGCWLTWARRTGPGSTVAGGRRDSRSMRDGCAAAGLPSGRRPRPGNRQVVVPGRVNPVVLPAVSTCGRVRRS